MKNYGMVVGWILVAAGLTLAYEGLTNTDIIQTIFGSFEPVVDVVVFGGAAVYKAWWLLTGKKKK